MNHFRQTMLHAGILIFAFLTLFPFVFMLNGSLRTNSEMYHGFFGLPEAGKHMAGALWRSVSAPGEAVQVVNEEGKEQKLTPGQATVFYAREATKGYRYAWKIIRPYMRNTILVCLSSALGVILLGSVSAYILARHRFFGSNAVYFYVISTMMFPGILMLVPSFLLVKSLGLLNSYGVLILPYIAGGQVFAIFVFRSFFQGLPEDLFESARIDGAGHFRIYWNIVVPLSKPIISVVLVMDILGTWNNFLWPFITNNSEKYHVIASGIYTMTSSAAAADTNMNALLAAYTISSIPLLILFVFATKPFIQGVTSGAFKA